MRSVLTLTQARRPRRPATTSKAPPPTSNATTTKASALSKPVDAKCVGPLLDDGTDEVACVGRWPELVVALVGAGGGYAARCVVAAPADGALSARIATMPATASMIEMVRARIRFPATVEVFIASPRSIRPPTIEGTLSNFLTLAKPNHAFRRVKKKVVAAPITMRSAENTTAIPSGSAESFPGAAPGRDEVLWLPPGGVLPGAVVPPGAVLPGAVLPGALLPVVPLRAGADDGAAPLPLGAAGPDPLGCTEPGPPGPEGGELGCAVTGGEAGGVLQDVLPEHGGGGG